MHTATLAHDRQPGPRTGGLDHRPRRRRARGSTTRTRAALVLSGIMAWLAVAVVAAPSASALPRVCDSFVNTINRTWNTYVQTGTHGDLLNYAEALRTAESVGCL